MIILNQLKGTVTRQRREDTDPARNDKEDNLSDQVVEFLLSREVDEMANLTVKNIAKNFDVNPSFLSRKFLEEKKIHLGEHIMQMKIYRSALLLIMTDSQELTVSKLAKLMGFCNSSYFIDSFKKYFGIGPGKYRECTKWKNII